MLEMMTAAVKPAAGADEAVFDKPGSWSFKVPDGVTRVCGIIVSPGGGGGGSNNINIYGAGGGGGGMFWFNDLPVTPGEEFTFSIPSGGGEGGAESGGQGSAGAIIRLNLAGKQQVDVSGAVSGGLGSSSNPDIYPGTGARNPVVYGDRIYNNGASKYNAAPGFNGISGGNGTVGKNGIGGKAGGYNQARSEPGQSLYGSGGKNPVYGGGGGGAKPQPGQPPAKGGQGQGGAVRFMWGDGKSFPFNAS